MLTEIDVESNAKISFSKGERAVQTTIAIIEAFAQLRELQRTVAELSETKDEFQQKTLMQKGGDIISELIGDNLQTSDTETSIELNFAVLKFKHTVKRRQLSKQQLYRAYNYKSHLHRWRSVQQPIYRIRYYIYKDREQRYYYTILAANRPNKKNVTNIPQKICIIP